MGRRQEPNPRLPKTISMPQHVWNIVDTKTNNRSRYIERAIKVYDDGTDPADYDIELMDEHRIAGKLYRRMRNRLGEDNELVQDMLSVYMEIESESLRRKFGGNQE